MISNRVQAFRIAHGIVRKGESLADMLKELTHGDFMPSRLPLHDAPVIAVKPESTVSALMVESRREDNSVSESPRKTRKHSKSRVLGCANDGKRAVSPKSLNWLSDLRDAAMRNRPIPTIAVIEESDNV